MVYTVLALKDVPVLLIPRTLFGQDDVPVPLVILPFPGQEYLLAAFQSEFLGSGLNLRFSDQHDM